MKELRVLSSDALRGLCVKHNWYTSGSNCEYENLLNYVKNKKNLETCDIVCIATDIIEHSPDLEYPLSVICYEIEKECITFFKEEENIKHIRYIRQFASRLLDVPYDDIIVKCFSQDEDGLYDATVSFDVTT
ncbi:MAG: hypothetical protein QXI16_02895, partial [Sulfolobaceae archaeon]